mmetsp:Transcript_11060/g.25766  ORF Transcript_11060/g.25766 Transcript_11060/m.25766 type:complete len:117 (+) Transcript_11060:1497-1847(+)
MLRKYINATTATMKAPARPSERPNTKDWLFGSTREIGGVAEGFPLGEPDGNSLGLAVVGDKLGLAVGATVGPRVTGLSVGGLDMEGDMLGSAVGSRSSSIITGWDSITGIPNLARF